MCSVAALKPYDLSHIFVQKQALKGGLTRKNVAEKMY